MTTLESITPEEAYELGKQAAIEDFQKMSAEAPLAPGQKPGPIRAAAKLPMDNPPKMVDKPRLSIPAPAKPAPATNLIAGTGRKATAVASK